MAHAARAAPPAPHPFRPLLRLRLPLNVTTDYCRRSRFCNPGSRSKSADPSYLTRRRSASAFLLTLPPVTAAAAGSGTPGPGPKARTPRT
eukprot:527616-Prorocentrum_minimum.AAC.1